MGRVDGHDAPPPGEAASYADQQPFRRPQCAQVIAVMPNATVNDSTTVWRASAKRRSVSSSMRNPNSTSLVVLDESISPPSKKMVLHT
jgi:hypothetical protein